MMLTIPLASVAPELVIVSVVAGVLALPLFVLVHRGSHYCCLAHAKRYCRKNGIELKRWRCGPQFDATGVKTEFTVIQLDCLDGEKRRKLISLSVWIFGVRKVLADEGYPESLDDRCFLACE
jgi:hypothetical protein